MSAIPTIPDANDLTLEEKIGQMLCLGWSGPGCFLSLNDPARECIGAMKAGGMVIMGRNISPHQRPLPSINAAAVRAMIGEMQALSAIPLLIATDQEGGRVARFGTAPFTRMPSAQVIGQRGDTTLAYRAARSVAEELAAVGVNGNFAPVADIHSHPQNPVIGDRAFGETAEQVVPLILAQIKGYQDGGVLACVKHFPGHGDTALDSHHHLPTLPFTLSQMQERELIPFNAAIEAGVAAIMTAHIVFPALDPDLPATLSQHILTGLLREQLGFDNLIITDCMEMKAVSEGWGTARAAVLAAKAGADILLICHTLTRQREAHRALIEAARTGELPESRIHESAIRILAAKRRLAAFPRPPLDRIGAPEHIALRDAFAAPLDNAPTTLGATA